MPRFSNGAPIERGSKRRSTIDSPYASGMMEVRTSISESVTMTENLPSWDRSWMFNFNPDNSLMRERRRVIRLLVKTRDVVQDAVEAIAQSDARLFGLDVYVGGVDGECAAQDNLEYLEMRYAFLSCDTSAIACTTSEIFLNPAIVFFNSSDEMSKTPSLLSTANERSLYRPHARSNDAREVIKLGHLKVGSLEHGEDGGELVLLGASDGDRYFFAHDVKRGALSLAGLGLGDEPERVRIDGDAREVDVPDAVLAPRVSAPGPPPLLPSGPRGCARRRLLSS